MTARQCKAARALLDWTQFDLAVKANVGTSTVADFERGARDPIPVVREAMIDAFYSARVRFIENGVYLDPRR